MHHHFVLDFNSQLAILSSNPRNCQMTKRNGDENFLPHQHIILQLHLVWLWWQIQIAQNFYGNVISFFSRSLIISTFLASYSMTLQLNSSRWWIFRIFFLSVFVMLLQLNVVMIIAQKLIHLNHLNSSNSHNCCEFARICHLPTTCDLGHERQDDTWTTKK